MSKRSATSVLMLSALVVLTGPALAGDHGEHAKCSHEAQVCVNYMAENLQKRGWAGVELDQATMTVKEVSSGTPADRAGVRVGDVLVAINDTRVADATPETMHQLAAKMTPGASMRYTVSRKGQERSFELTLDPMPEDAIARIVGKHMLQGHADVQIAQNRE